MKKEEIKALTKLNNGVRVVTPSIYYQCPNCKKAMITEYNFEDSEEYIICIECKKVYSLILKEVDKKFNFSKEYLT